MNEKDTWLTPHFEVKDILQIDATVIAGVLVLFTLSAAVQTSVNEKLTFTIYPLIIIIPFALSAMCALGFTKWKYCRALTILGFMFLIMYLSVITSYYVLDYVFTKFFKTPISLFPPPNNASKSTSEIPHSNSTIIIRTI
jgi:hypothetical protein